MSCCLFCCPRLYSSETRIFFLVRTVAHLPFLRCSFAVDLFEFKRKLGRWDLLYAVCRNFFFFKFCFCPLTVWVVLSSLGLSKNLPIKLLAIENGHQWPICNLISHVTLPDCSMLTASPLYHRWKGQVLTPRVWKLLFFSAWNCLPEESSHERLSLCHTLKLRLKCSVLA